MLLNEKDLLQDLVRIPSVNPDFEVPDGLARGETALTDYLQGLLEQLGWPWLRQEVHPGRDNLLTVCGLTESTASQEVMMWEVHQDTVGVMGMKVPPFGAEESDNRIWGRGACDVKGGMAAMLTGLAKAMESSTPLCMPIMLAFTINEENGFTGAKTLCELWNAQDPTDEKQQGIQGTLPLDELRKLIPAQVIVAEPTGLDVVVSHKGCMRWECVALGRAAHSSQPHLGINAIYGMTEVVGAIRKYEHEVLERRAAHPLCGKSTLNVGTIRGGVGVNTVPDRAVIDIELRTIPGDKPEDARQQLIDFISASLANSAVKIEHGEPHNRCAGLQERGNREWAEQVATAAQALGLPGRLVGVPYGTNAWVYAAQGWPTVVFGPGSIDQAHTDDEWIAVEQLSRATEVFRCLALGE